MSFQRASLHDKLSFLDSDIQEALRFSRPALAPALPARDVALCAMHELPPKARIGQSEGQARLLHDLANIELQAVELCLRTLHEFPQAPAGFRAQLADIAREEGKHLRLCVEGLELLGSRWGAWPVHAALWQACSREDSLLDRIVIVHRYLEGAGLDAGEGIMKRLSGIAGTSGARHVRLAVDTIVREEVAHVNFGSQWYRALCRDEGLDPEADFPRRLQALCERLPRRILPLAHERRRQAGFSEGELQALESLRQQMIRS